MIRGWIALLGTSILFFILYDAVVPGKLSLLDTLVIAVAVNAAVLPHFWWKDN